MDYEDFLVVLCCLLIAIARLKETSFVRHGVRGPLLGGCGEECAAKESCVFEPMGEHRFFLLGGRATFAKSSWSNREFDATRGFPGEDILPPPLH